MVITLNQKFFSSCSTILSKRSNIYTVLINSFHLIFKFFIFLKFDIPYLVIDLYSYF